MNIIWTNAVSLDELKPALEKLAAAVEALRKLVASAPERPIIKAEEGEQS